MPNGTFVVDRTLGALPIARLLDVRTTLRASGILAAPVTIAGDRPVLSGDQTLQPNVLYPSEKNTTLRYYLPQYHTSLDSLKHPAVELRYKDDADDEVGRLTLTLAWTPPQAAGLVVRPMDHVAALTLRYRIPVENTAGATSGPGWEHTLALQPLQPTGNLLAQSTTIFRDKTMFDTVYQALRSPAQDATLDIQIRAHVGIRTWRQVIVGRPGLVDKASVLKSRGALFTNMVSKESLSTLLTVPKTGVAKINLAAASTQLSDTIPFKTLAGRAAAPRLVGPMVASAGPTAAISAASAARLDATALRFAVAPRPMIAMSPRIPPGVSATIPVPPPTRPPIVTRPSIPATSPGHTRPAPTAPAAPKSNVSALTMALASSDLHIAGRPAVPIRVVLDPLRQPAIVDADLDNQQSLPFHFDPSLPENQDVFAVAGFDSGGIHLLLPLRLTAPDGSAYVVYQDNLMRDVVHVAPSEFRLERDTTPPFLPALSFLASDFSTTDASNDQDADVLFRVAAVYRLEPWLDPDVVELARAELARQGLVARFTTSMSHDATLSLDLDLLEDQQQRKDATVDPATGITDSLDLDHNTFVRLWRERLSNPASGGITGHVDYKLFDGSPAQVKVQLSLWEASAELFDVAFVGPVEGQPGRYRVMVRNRIESPARITALPGEVIEGGMARAVDPATIVGQLFQPEEARQIDYDVTGAPADLLSFEPTVLARPEPNLPALLKLLMLSTGYTSLGFSLTVKAAANVFGPPAAGAEPLTGLIVEFDDGSRVTLSSSNDQVNVTLVGRLIDQILGTADDSQRYFYRVTNLHASGEGARTSWVEGEGATPLEVGTAIVRLDF
jgi:hypothetical protein